MNPKRLRSYIYLVIVAAIWGAAGPVIKFTLRELPPFTFLTYRFLITSLVSTDNDSFKRKVSKRI